MASDFIWRWRVVSGAIFVACLDSTVEKLKHMKLFLEFAAILGAFSSQVFCIFPKKNSTSESENVGTLTFLCQGFDLGVCTSSITTDQLMPTDLPLANPTDTNASTGSHVRVSESHRGSSGSWWDGPLMVLKCFLCSTEIGFTWVVDQIASADFLIELNKEKREKEEKRKPVVALILFNKSAHGDKYRKSSVLAFFLLNLIFGWCVMSVSVSRAAASTSTMSPKHLRRSVQHLRACQIFVSQWALFVYQNINVIKVQRKAHMHPRMLSPFGYICMTACPTFIPFGSAELSSGLEIVPGPRRLSMSTRTTDERLLGAGEKKCFPYVSTPQTYFFF